MTARVFARHRPRPDWPSKEHRSMGQVARTIELRTMPRKLCALELEELKRLDEKSVSFNPPPDNTESAA